MPGTPDDAGHNASHGLAGTGGIPAIGRSPTGRAPAAHRVKRGEPDTDGAAHAHPDPAAGRTAQPPLLAEPTRHRDWHPHANPAANGHAHRLADRQPNTYANPRPFAGLSVASAVQQWL